MHLREENMSLLKRIWDLNSSATTYNLEKFPHLTRSNSSLRKKHQEDIKQ
jgi:hypothetical protein